MAHRISPAERTRLVECIQYLNLQEMRSFCGAHDLPLYIHIERSDGSLRRTGDRDRKDVVLSRILEYALHGRRSGPTTYVRDVVSTGPLPARLSSRTRIRSGQYEKHNPHFVKTMKTLTEGAFRTGMIARLVLRDAWTAGRAPTFRQFADEWIRATKAHTRPRPEGAYLVDLWKGEAGPNWKQIRVEKAKEALQLLRKSMGE